MYYTVRIIQNIMHRIKYNRMENSINGSRYRHILRQRGGCARGYAGVPPRPPPPPQVNFVKYKIKYIVKILLLLLLHSNASLR